MNDTIRNFTFKINNFSVIFCHITVYSFEDKRVIIRQGHMADNFYLIISGTGNYWTYDTKEWDIKVLKVKAPDTQERINPHSQKDRTYHSITLKHN